MFYCRSGTCGEFAMRVSDRCNTADLSRLHVAVICAVLIKSYAMTCQIAIYEFLTRALFYLHGVINVLSVSILANSIDTFNYIGTVMYDSTSILQFCSTNYSTSSVTMSQDSLM